MKKLFFAIICVLASASLVASDYRQALHASLDAYDYPAADSILSAWSAAEPDDPALYAGRFRYLLEIARNPTVNRTTQSHQEEGMSFIYESVEIGFTGPDNAPNDSLVREAFKTIDAGIARNPGRLDLHLDKASGACSFNRFDVCADAVDSIITRSQASDFQWLDGNNEPMPDARGELPVLLYDYLAGIQDAGCDSLALRLADRMIEVFPDNILAFNFPGAYYYNRGEYDEALEYFERALAIAPGDNTIKLNIALVKFRQGKNDEALEIYSTVVNDPEANFEQRTQAARMIDHINTPLRPMEKYAYFFDYLPFCAGRLAEYIAAGDVHHINSTVLASNGFSSPFTDSQIKAEVFEDGDRQIYVWTFPQPEDIPMCHYVAFVPEGDAFRLYTLEKSLEGAWLVGSQYDGVHANFGGVMQPVESSEIFVQLLKSLALSGNEPQATFTRPGR